MMIDSGFSCNSVIWLTSTRVGEDGPTNRMVEDLRLQSELLGFGFQVVNIDSKLDFESIFIELVNHARDRNMKPMVHIDMHGCSEQGLLVCKTNEYISWECAAQHFRELNVATNNNLCVIGAACHALRAVIPIKLDKPTPFFILLAPEQQVEEGFLIDNIVQFYRCLFESGSIEKAYSRHISDEFKYFHCEKMLFIVIAKYIKEKCKGKGAQERREQLLTEIFIGQSDEIKSEKITEVRRIIKNGIKPEQSLLDRYAKTFLISRNCSFNIDDLIGFIENT
ncbi:hypothetical protein [Vibrio sp. Hep-1b-8]|uniref:hypothetical protein n=1 Tax=Vibrio sp. Hep-1b-8 TaxID=2144187 RepID=UPI0011108BA1|nr:hypothetical protein [Vibrio sp. Hep-1b-8]TMX38249.1 hypothetical protein DA100_10645 [Vibrio sp. Hep-1b-8]